MKLLLIEDDHDKVKLVKEMAYQIENNALIEVAGSLSSAHFLLNQKPFDLIIIDFLLPSTDHATSEKKVHGLEVLRLIEASKHNKSAHLLALTAYPDYASAHEKAFSDSGVILVQYSTDNTEWKSTLVSLLRKVAARPRRKFAIVCALDEEREAFLHTSAIVSQSYISNSMDVCDIRIGEHLGCLILCPRMGLINAAIITTMAIERFSIDYVLMAGICAGLKSKSEIGQVLIPNPCWEFQVGKFSGSDFEIEQYQVSLHEELRQKIAFFLSNILEPEHLYAGTNLTEKPSVPAKLATFASGSAVIASERKLTEIKKQHRKLCGLDMESFSVMLASELNLTKVRAISAKTVVDFADETKGDNYHEAATVISARFVVSLLTFLLADATTD